jgi:hypothetical protein
VVSARSGVDGAWAPEAADAVGHDTSPGPVAVPWWQLIVIVAIALVSCAVLVAAGLLAWRHSGLTRDPSTPQEPADVA